MGGGGQSGAVRDEGELRSGMSRNGGGRGLAEQRRDEQERGGRTSMAGNSTPPCVGQDRDPAGTLSATNFAICRTAPSGAGPTWSSWQALFSLVAIIDKKQSDLAESSIVGVIGG